jgi:hypothetical protein
MPPEHLRFPQAGIWPLAGKGARRRIAAVKAPVKERWSKRRSKGRNVARRIGCACVNAGRTRVPPAPKSWANAGQTLVKRWSNAGQGSRRPQFSRRPQKLGPVGPLTSV